MPRLPGDVEKKVSRGQRSPMTAATWNLIIDAVKKFRRDRFQEGPGGTLANEISPSLTALVRNNVETYPDSFRVLALGDPVLDPEGDGGNLAERFAFEGSEPVAGGPVGILQGPCAADEFGRAVVSGLAVCWVLVDDEGHRWANPEEGETGYLRSAADCGQARILWAGDAEDAPPVEGAKLAVVNLIGAACPTSAQGVSSWKNVVRAATTANVTLSTALENADTLDGVVLATGDRVLVKNQSSSSQNGIYVVNVSGAPTRAADADGVDELVGAVVFVSEGDDNGDTIWACTTDATITPGSTGTTWARVWPAQTLASVLAKVTVTDTGSGHTVEELDSTHTGTGTTYSPCYSVVTGLAFAVNEQVELFAIPGGGYWIQPAQYASTNIVGWVSKGTQSFSGNKTFLNYLIAYKGFRANDSLDPAEVFSVGDALSTGSVNGLKYYSSETYASTSSRVFEVFGGNPTDAPGLMDVGGVLRLAHLADADAPNDSIYVSTDAGTLVYKDSDGNVGILPNAGGGTGSGPPPPPMAGGPSSHGDPIFTAMGDMRLPDPL